MQVQGGFLFGHQQLIIIKRWLQVYPERCRRAHFYSITLGSF